MNPATDSSARLLERKSAALLLIDLQAKLLPAIFESDRLIRNCRLLSHFAQLLRLPTVLTTQYAKGLGSVVPEISSTLPEVQPFDKTSFGCFGDQEFQRHVRNLAPHANTLLVAGIETHICVTQTVLGAIEAGYLVHVAADATSSRTAENWQIGLKRMERAGAVISSTEMMVYELLGRSDTPEFKAILPLIK